MNQIYSSKLTKRFLIRTMIIIVFVFGLIYWITVHELNASIEQEISYRDQLIAKTMSRRMKSTFSRMLNDTRIIANYIVNDQSKDKHLYFTEMERVFSYNPLYKSVAVYSKTDEPIVSVPNVILKDNTFVAPILNRLKWSKSYYISNLVQLPNGHNTIVIGYPVIDQSGNYLGAVMAFVDLDTLSNYLKELNIGKDGFNAIVDRNGTIIGNNDALIIGYSLIKSPLYPLIYRETYGIWQGELLQKNVIIAHRPLSFGGFSIIIGETMNQALAPSRDLRGLLLEIFFVVLIVSVPLVLSAVSNVLKPILHLTEQAREYKENKRRNFEFIKTDDEIEDLSNIMEQMAKELTDKERRLFYILESIPYSIITTDIAGKITTFNKEAEQLTLFNREETIGKYIIDLPFKENVEEFISWKTIQNGKEYNEVESYIYDKEKQLHDVRLYSSILRGEDFKPIGAIVVIRDVSEIKKLEEYIKQNERLASIGQLTAGVAHEINNPLSIIHAAGEAIQLEINEDSTDIQLIGSLTEDILETTVRMKHLLEDFLKLSKGDLSEEQQPVDILLVLQELLHLLRNQINDLNFKVHQIFEVKQAFVHGSKNQLTQLFLNIILNGIQAMEYHGELYVRVKELSKCWIIEIEDTGKGMPPSQLQRIYNPFFSTKNGGTGLGLSIVHEIVVKHHGKIYATSEEGKGTCFYIELPKDSIDGGEE